MNILARMLRSMGVLAFYNGHLQMAVLGMKLLARMQRSMGILGFYNGHMKMAVLGIVGLARMQRAVGILSVLSMRYLMDVRANDRSCLHTSRLRRTCLRHAIYPNICAPTSA